MAMHNFVVVDAAIKTRLVASALSSGEKIQNCRWVLQQLLSATGAPPLGIMIGKDLAMEMASARSLTLLEFDVHWDSLIASFDDNAMVIRYLTKIHEDRARWCGE
ncbi:hypothetical protein BGX24_007873, partial [Mortierella sp. AD032]